MQCEDYPCCGHEFGDCDGSKYGSDESIKQKFFEKMDDEYLYDWEDEENGNS